jgi:hypothetical protein
MKATIKGRIYDTNKATLIATYTNFLPITDDYYEDVLLYVKKNGEYFLHCHGGSKTEFAVIKDNKIYSGQYIIPIMNDAFSGWVSAHSKLIDFLLFIASAKQHKSFYNFRQKN